MTERKVLSTEQANIRDEFVSMHGLEPKQISFEGKETTPIFDYEAVCALSLKLTDIQDLDCWLSERDTVRNIAIARCRVTLPDGRTRTTEDSAQTGEIFGDGGKTIDSFRLAEVVAQARAVRRGIRSVGINLARAHEEWKQNGGNPVNAHTNNDPRLPHYQEIHAQAVKLGLINGAEKSEYQKFLAEMFDGRSSSKELDDIELHRLLVTFRAMVRHQAAAVKASEKLVA